MFEKLSMWCHKVIPLVYDDALSYYEAICKVVAKVNELVQGVNDVTETAVFSVNGKKPESGNVAVGTVTSVDGKEPDSDGKVVVGAVTSVNSVKPDDNGNVKAGTVRSVNGSTPDEEGNVNLPTVSGVTSVDGVGADSEGNVPLNAVKKVNDIAPDSEGNVNVGTVKSVNNASPDSAGNVNVGTVKSVNSVSPDSAGNVNVGTVKSVNSVSPDSAGNVVISAESVGAIANRDNVISSNLLADNTISRGRLENSAKYLEYRSRNNSAGIYITSDWGNFWNSMNSSGTWEITNEETHNLYNSWRCEIYSSYACSIRFNNLSELVNMETGENYLSQDVTIQLPIHRHLTLVKEYGGQLLIEGSALR